MFPFPAPLLCKGADAGGGLGSTPTFVATGGTSGSSAVSSTTVSYPAGIAANDILLLFVHLNDALGSASISSVTGSWALVQSIPLRNDDTAALYWKRATGSESGTETVTLSESTETGVVRANISAWRGCVTSGNPFELASLSYQAATTSHRGRPVETTEDNRLVVTFFGCQAADTTGAPTNGWTEQWESGTISGNDACESCNSIDVATAGFVDACARTESASVRNVAFTLALVPTGGAPTTRSGPTVRGSRISYVNNANSLVFSLPAGSQAGDQCVIFASHGWNVATPAGWNSLNNATGTNINGAAFEKVLTDADITAGSVTISFGGTYYGTVAGITFVGTTGGIRDFGFSRNSTGATSRSVATGSAPLTGDYAIYFGSTRGNTACTVDKGSSLQTSSQANASACLYGETLAADGPVTANFAFGAAGTGDYEGVVVIVP